MTTIAIRDGLLACDSRLTRGHHVLTDFATKAYVMPKGRGMMTFCGLVIDFTRFVDAAKKGVLHTLRMETTTDIVWARPNGTVRVWHYVDTGYGGHYDLSVPKDGLAWGSGSAYALGAMAANASLSRAIEIAAQRDIHTGGEIHVYNIATGERI